MDESFARLFRQRRAGERCEVGVEVVGIARAGEDDVDAGARRGRSGRRRRVGMGPRPAGSRGRRRGFDLSSAEGRRGRFAPFRRARR